MLVASTARKYDQLPSHATFDEKTRTGLETDTVISVVDLRVLNNDIVTAIHVPPVRVFRFVPRCGDGGDVDVAVHDIFALIHLIRHT